MSNRSILRIAICFFVILNLAHIQLAWAKISTEKENQATVVAATQQGNPQRVSRAILGSNSPTQETIEFQRRAVIPQRNTAISTNILPLPVASQEHKLRQKALADIPAAKPTAATISLNRHEKQLISKAQRYINQNWNENTGLID